MLCYCHVGAVNPHTTGAFARPHHGIINRLILEVLCPAALTSFVATAIVFVSLQRQFLCRYSDSFSHELDSVLHYRHVSAINPHTTGTFARAHQSIIDELVLEVFCRYSDSFSVATATVFSVSCVVLFKFKAAKNKKPPT